MPLNPNGFQLGDVVTYDTANPKIAKLYLIEGFKAQTQYRTVARLRVVMSAQGGSTAYLGAMAGDKDVKELQAVNPMLVIARVASGEHYWEAFKLMERD